MEEDAPRSKFLTACTQVDVEVNYITEQFHFANIKAMPNYTLYMYFVIQQHMMSPMIHQHGSSHQLTSLGPATPGPMTPMTPSSADPGIVPQLQ